MVILYGETWSQFRGRGCSIEIQRLERMKICSNQS